MATRNVPTVVGYIPSVQTTLKRSQSRNWMNLMNGTVKIAGIGSRKKRTMRAKTKWMKIWRLKTMMRVWLTMIKNNQGMNSVTSIIVAESTAAFQASKAVQVMMSFSSDDQ
jgi:hypothetical protein